LSADKKRAKRVIYALEQSLTAWGGPTKIKFTQNQARQEGAKLNWEEWWANHRIYLHKKIGEPCTKQELNRLQNELRWVQHALR
jgi:hypothetical protein